MPSGIMIEEVLQALDNIGLRALKRALNLIRDSKNLTDAMDQKKKKVAGDCIFCRTLAKYTCSQCKISHYCSHKQVCIAPKERHPHHVASSCTRGNDGKCPMCLESFPDGAFQGDFVFGSGMCTLRCCHHLHGKSMEDL